MASATQHDAAIAVMDSGLGGIAVVRALKALAPEAALTYIADTAGFPYGKRTPADLTARSIAIVKQLLMHQELQQVVLACNTLSTLCLAELRAQFPMVRFVGTVPAIKVAAGISKTRRFTLLATPNTAASRYSDELVQQFASDCVVDRYGAPHLAAMSEAQLLGEPVSGWAEEIAPAFFNDAQGRTDTVILGCTHYPLVLDQLRAHASWPVEWIDASAAIARHALRDIHPAKGACLAYVTGPDVARYASVFEREGFSVTDRLHEAMAA